MLEGGGGGGGRWGGGGEKGNGVLIATKLNMEEMEIK